MIGSPSGSGSARAALRTSLLDLARRPLGLLGAAVRQQPARALGHVAAHEEDREREHRAEAEARAASPIDPTHVRIEQPRRGQRAERGADPEAAVDREVDAAAHARRDQLVDRRVDRRVLAADARAR